MKKQNCEKLIEQIGFPKDMADIKINHSKEYQIADKELSAYINKLPITKDQRVEILILTAQFLIRAEIDAYIQSLGDGFDKGADWTQKYIDNICKENSEKYDILFREKISKE